MHMEMGTGTTNSPGNQTNGNGKTKTTNRNGYGAAVCDVKAREETKTCVGKQTALRTIWGQNSGA